MGIWVMLLPMSIIAERFTQDNSVVIDSKTALEWQSKPTTSKYDQKEAIKHCSDLKYGGHGDWRLPNLNELKSLVNYAKYNPAISTTLISIKTDDYYWTSSEYKNNSYRAWIVDFEDGNDFWRDELGKYYALCVRG